MREKIFWLQYGQYWALQEPHAIKDVDNLENSSDMTDHENSHEYNPYLLN